MQLDFFKELKFAETFYEAACKGLEESEYSPKPLIWLANAGDYVNAWELLKMDLLSEEDPERKADIKQFLSCTIAVYTNFMCNLSRLYVNNMMPPDEIPVKEDSEDDSDKGKGEITDMEYLQFPIEQTLNESSNSVPTNIL
jgi:hypothetical protein